MSIACGCRTNHLKTNFTELPEKIIYDTGSNYENTIIDTAKIAVVINIIKNAEISDDDLTMFKKVPKKETLVIFTHNRKKTITIRDTCLIYKKQTYRISYDSRVKLRAAFGLK